MEVKAQLPFGVSANLWAFVLIFLMTLNLLPGAYEQKLIALLLNQKITALGKQLALL